MAATAQTSWFWSDWLGDQAVRRLTPAERGVWIDLLALAAVGSPFGYVCDERGRALSFEEIARVTNAGSPEEVSKLIAGIVDKGAASRDRTGRLFNRRMVRDAQKAVEKKHLAEKRANAGRTGGEHTRDKWRQFHGNQNLPQQMPRRVSGQLPRQSLDNHSSPPNITSSFPVAAREGLSSETLEDNIKRRGWSSDKPANAKAS
jgi:hypothetical protein